VFGNKQKQMKETVKNVNTKLSSCLITNLDSMHIHHPMLTPLGRPHADKSRNSEVNASSESFVIWNRSVMELFAVALLCFVQVTKVQLKFQITTD
jgi:hypothetical protein